MRRWRFAVLCLLLAAGFAALGVWQVERRAWKLDLIARVEARIHAPPRPMPFRIGSPAAVEYLRVMATGTFLHDRETLVQAVTDRGPGWWVMTPLATTRGVVLVNRGFVPAGRRNPATRAAGQMRGALTVVGLLRASEPGGGFLRANAPAEDRWYSRDVGAIARARGLGAIPQVFVDADATVNPGGYPIGGLTVVGFRNAHLAYALTWFGLAALALVGAGVVWRRGER